MLAAHQVVPPEYGTAQDPLHFLTALPRACVRRMAKVYRDRRSSATSRWWTPVQDIESDDVENGPKSFSGDEEEAGVETNSDPRDFEPLNASSVGGARGGGALGGGSGAGEDGVVISELRKEFGAKVAVAGLNLRLLPGDITCILGHNGAGEMLTTYRH